MATRAAAGTPALRVWIAAERVEHRRTLAAAFSTAGVTVLATPDPGSPAVLVVDAAVCTAAAVALLSGGGERRLVVLVAGRAGTDPWQLLAAGASDVVEWDGRSDVEPAAVVARIKRWYLVDQLATSKPVTDRFVGRSREWGRLLRWLVEIARFSDASVLLTGESGTGKELAARLVHALDPHRNTGPFVVVDCTTIVETLSAPELFGHERGAFTGAHTARDGAFLRADGGVLFLDEVGDLPPALQPELLRVLQERAVKPLGSTRWRSTDFRLVCATNRDLDELQADGSFRRDLRARLSAVTVRLPSLAERHDDIPLLTRHFLHELLGADAPDLDPAVEAYLLDRPYPGNVRELRQLVTRLAVRYVGGGRLTAGTVPETERPGQQPTAPSGGPDDMRAAVRTALARGADLRTLKATVAALAVELALVDAGGNVGRAAQRLGVTPRALQLRRAGEADPASVTARV